MTRSIQRRPARTYIECVLVCCGRMCILRALARVACMRVLTLYNVNLRRSLSSNIYIYAHVCTSSVSCRVVFMGVGGSCFVWEEYYVALSNHRRSNSGASAKRFTEGNFTAFLNESEENTIVCIPRILDHAVSGVVKLKIDMNHNLIMRWAPQHNCVRRELSANSKQSGESIRPDAIGFWALHPLSLPLCLHPSY